MSSEEMPSFHIIECDPLIDSSLMGPKEWCKIACDIEKNYLKYDGFVVIMGTDTMVFKLSIAYKLQPLKS